MYTNYIITAIGIIIIYNHVIFRLSKKDKLTDSNSISKQGRIQGGAWGAVAPPSASGV